MSWTDFDIEADSDCPEVRAAELEHQVDELPRSRWLRRRRSFAGALEEVERAMGLVWQEQTVTDDWPGWYTTEEDVEGAAAVLSLFKKLVFGLIGALSEARRVLADLVAAIETRASLFGPQSLDHDSGPPGHLVSISPNRPNGPPLHRVAIFHDDVMAAAA